MAKHIYNQTALFGELYAYLVVISPPDLVLKHIAAFKREMDAIARIGDKNLHSIGHITLTDRLTDDDTFQETIADLLKCQKKFMTKLSGIGHFDHKSRHTVFIKVENPGPIANLMQLVKSPSKTPHLSLAKKIQPQTFDALQPYLGKINFETEWLCEEVLVLRKLMKEKEKGFREQFRIALE